MNLEDIQNLGPIDKSKINPPKIQLTRDAAMQLLLLQKNDFTLQDKYFRLKIDGKGCDGFTYAAGFTEFYTDDIEVKISVSEQFPPLTVLVDPFTAFYLQRVVVDYVFDPVNGLEGFLINNLQQQEFEGKFWKKDASKVPPTVPIQG